MVRYLARDPQWRIATGHKGEIMRLPESIIQASILHPEEEIRLAAVAFFSGSHSSSETVMPRVVRAVERYGRNKAFRILRSAERLRQTEATVDWLLGELRRAYAADERDEDNYRYAIALVLFRAEPELLQPRRGEIAALPMFPAPLRAAFDERLEWFRRDWEQGCAALEALAGQSLRKGRLTASDARRADCIVESLARHAATKAATALDLLRRSQQAGCAAWLRWCRPWIMSLAGAMRLDAAVPLAVTSLCDDDLNVADESTTALVKIGNDAVVRAIAACWPSADAGFRAAASDVLEHIHSGLCGETALKFFTAEEDRETKLCLAHAVLSQFLSDGVEPVRQLVLAEGAEVPPNGLDIRRRLVASCAVMGVSFPEFAAWYAEAVADNWGLGNYRPHRVADDLPPHRPEPKRS
jgi:hypothetical protein